MPEQAKEAKPQFGLFCFSKNLNPSGREFRRQQIHHLDGRRLRE